MMLYIENHEESTENLLELINEFNKVAGYKIDTHTKKDCISVQ